MTNKPKYYRGKGYISLHYKTWGWSAAYKFIEINGLMVYFYNYNGKYMNRQSAGIISLDERVEEIQNPFIDYFIYDNDEFIFQDTNET